MKKRGDEVRAHVARQGAVKVQGASVWEDAGTVVCLYLTLESKHAECDGITTHQNDESCLAFGEGVFTKPTHETAKGLTLVSFPDFQDHEIWAWDGPGKCTVRVVLVKKELA